MLDIKSNENSWKLKNSCKLKYSLQKEKWRKIEIKKEIKYFVEYNENEYITYPKLWGKMEAVIIRELLVLTTNVKKLESTYTRNWARSLKSLDQIE